MSRTPDANQLRPGTWRQKSFRNAEKEFENFDAKLTKLEKKVANLHSLRRDDTVKEHKPNSDGPAPRPFPVEERAFGGTTPRTATSEGGSEASNWDLLDKLAEVNEHMAVIEGLVNGSRQSLKPMGPIQEPKERPHSTQSSSTKKATLPRSQPRAAENTTPKSVPGSSTSRNVSIKRGSETAEGVTKPHRAKGDYTQATSNGSQHQSGHHQMDSRAPLAPIREEEDANASKATVQKKCELPACKPLRAPAGNLEIIRCDDSSDDESNLSASWTVYQRPVPSGSNALPFPSSNSRKTSQPPRSHINTVTQVSTNKKETPDSSGSEDYFSPLI
uniref:CCDC92/74 N-terminal domain-containing protein n=1 Tax=Panagrellus redivivus TaxID=6233 RepID=A0A7E4UXF8_PANRE